jgi:hypothetical protein
MRHRILVVGLLPGQAARVERECGGGNVRLRFVEAKRNCDISSGGADHCVVMLKFVNHSHSAKAAKVFSRDRVHYNLGGLNELISMIRGITKGG